MLPMTPSTKTVLEGNSSGMGWIPPPRHLEDFVLYNASKAMRGATTQQEGASRPAGSIQTSTSGLRAPQQSALCPQSPVHVL